MDWAPDCAVSEIVDLCEYYSISATFFHTHMTELIKKRIIDSDRFENGIHPNFNNLLDGKEVDCAEKIIRKLRNMIPGSVSFRSHSLCTSSKLLSLCYKMGYRYCVNLHIPYFSGIVLSPFRHYCGIIRVPYFFADDGVLLEESLPDLDVNILLDTPGIKVFDFHPVHVYLNSSDLLAYESFRHNSFCPDVLFDLRNKGTGTGIKTILIGLIESALERGFKFSTINQINNE